MNKNIEIRIYELLGVKFFKKMAFIFRDKMCIFITLKMSKEERKEFLYYPSISDNYNLGKDHSYENIKKFKKKLFWNAGMHLLGLLILLPDFMNIIAGTAALSSTIITLIAVSINLYCVMLQRYNCIRINQLLKKMTPRYERQKNIIKEELKKDDLLLLVHSYKIIDRKGRQNNITFDDLIANANIEQLNKIRTYLACFKSIIELRQEKNGFYYDEQQRDVTIPMERQKLLKLELKSNKHIKGY